jgi:hypothetical protein
MNQAGPTASGDDDTMSARYYRSPVATRGICSMLLFTWLLEVSRLLHLPCLGVSAAALPIAAWRAAVGFRV